MRNGNERETSLKYRRRPTFLFVSFNSDTAFKNGYVDGNLYPQSMHKTNKTKLTPFLSSIQHTQLPKICNAT